MNYKKHNKNDDKHELKTSGKLQAILLRKTQMDKSTLTDNLRVSQFRNSEAISFRETDSSNGRMLSSDLRDDSLIESFSRTPVKQGENNDDFVCQILLERLNNINDCWKISNETIPIDIDRRINNGKISIDVQITKADHRENLFYNLNKNNDVKETFSISQLSLMIKSAINSKLTIPLIQRSQQLLALDATDTPNLSLDSVVEHFKNTNSEWAKTLSFHSIWLVGPTARLTFRLD